MPTICAVVLTHNRKDLLREALQTIENQSRKPDGVIVVDNHSTDGTGEMLGREFPRHIVVSLNENLGSAGGYGAGMRRAYEDGFDWIWVLDDDIEAAPGILERLRSFGDRSKFIQCSRQGPDGAVPLESLWSLDGGEPITLGKDYSFERSDRAYICVQWANFEGALIHRDIVARIGYPDPRFFLGDDSLYGFMASQYTDVLYLREVGIRRKLSYPARPSPLRRYLNIRNRFLHRDHFERLGLPVQTKVFWATVLITVAWSIKDGMRGRDRWMSVKATIQGLMDGRKRRFGRPPFVRA